jgi:hypothetical protein
MQYSALMAVFLQKRQLAKSYRTHGEISLTVNSFVLQVEADIELLEVCMKTIYFYLDE